MTSVLYTAEEQRVNAAATCTSTCTEGRTGSLSSAIFKNNCRWHYCLKIFLLRLTLFPRRIDHGFIFHRTCHCYANRILHISAEKFYFTRLYHLWKKGSIINSIIKILQSIHWFAKLFLNSWRWIITWQCHACQSLFGISLIIFYIDIPLKNIIFAPNFVLLPMVFLHSEIDFSVWHK